MKAVNCGEGLANIRIFLLLLAFSLVLSSLATAQNETIAPRKIMYVNLSGNCVNQSVVITAYDRGDNLLWGVDITVYLKKKLIASVTTNRDGVASFIPPEAGVYNLRITRSRFKSLELDYEVIKCESCSDGIQNQEEEGVDCGGPCEPCTTTTTTTTTTSTTTTSTSTTTSTTRRQTTTTEPTTTSTSTTTTTTTTLASGSGLDMSLVGVLVFLVAAVAIYVIYFRFFKVESEQEGAPHVSSELYKKSVEAAKMAPKEKYTGFKKKKEEEEEKKVEELNKELKSIREKWGNKPNKIEENPPTEDRIKNDFEEIERLESELKALRKGLKKS